MIGDRHVLEVSSCSYVLVDGILKDKMKHACTISLVKVRTCNIDVTTRPNVHHDDACRGFH
jgi:hypothetical protein